MPNPPDDAPDAPARLRARATWLVGRAFARSSALLGAGFEAHGDGLRGHHFRLLAALEEWGPASQADLGRRTGIDRSDVTAALNDLEDRGLAVRRPDPAHGRRKIVTATEQGLARLAELDTLVDGVQDDFLAPLTPAQRRKLVELLGLLTAAPPR